MWEGSCARGVCAWVVEDLQSIFSLPLEQNGLSLSVWGVAPYDLLLIQTYHTMDSHNCALCYFILLRVINKKLYARYDCIFHILIKKSNHHSVWHLGTLSLFSLFYHLPIIRWPCYIDRPTSFALLHKLINSQVNNWKTPLPWGCRYNNLIHCLWIS